MSFKKTDEIEANPVDTEEAPDTPSNLLDAYEGILPLELIDEMEKEVASEEFSPEPTDSVHYDDEEEDLIARLDYKLQPETIQKARRFVQGLFMGIAFADRKNSGDLPN